MASCAHCSAPSPRYRCPCGGACYCDSSCQKSHFKAHKPCHKERTAPFLTEIDGLPKVAGHEGFRALGKLRGAHRRMWRAGCSALVDAIVTCCNDDINGELPMFTLLSPQQRIHLLREVAVGLLCESTPLPPETVWHYNAYYAPMHYVAFVEITVEADLEGDRIADLLRDATSKCHRPQGDSGESDVAAKGPTYDMHNIVAESTLFSLETKARVKHENLQRKSYKRGKSTATLLSEMSETTESGTVRPERETDDVVQHYLDVTAAIEKGEASRDDEYKLGQAELLKSTPWAFHWREIMESFLHGEYNPLLTPRSTETDFHLWGKVYASMCGGLFAWPGKKSSLFINLLFRPLDQGVDKVRDCVVHREAKRSAALFEDFWTPVGSSMDIRIHAALADPDDPLDCGLFEQVYLLRDDDKARNSSETCFKIATETLEAKSAEQVSYEVGTARAWSWAHLWHKEMEHDLRGYQSLDARFGAVLAAAQRATNSDVTACIWKQTPYYLMNNDIVKETPAESLLDRSYYSCNKCDKIEGRDDVKLRSCKGCGVIHYCSARCQRKDRKLHKQVCKHLKMIRETGEKTKDLPTDVIRQNIQDPMIAAKKAMHKLNVANKTSDTIV